MATAQVTPELAHYLDLKLAALGQPTARTASDSLLLETVGPLLAQLPPEGLDAGPVSVSGRPAHSILPGRLPASRFAPAARLACPATRLFWIAPAWRESCLCRSAETRSLLPICIVSHPSRGPAQPRQRPPHHPGSFSHCRRRLAGFPPTSRPCRSRPSPHCSPPRFKPPPDVLTLPFTAGQAEQARLVRLAAVAAAGLSRYRSRSGKDHGDSLLRAGKPGQQSRFRGSDFRQRRRSVSSGK